MLHASPSTATISAGGKDSLPSEGRERRNAKMTKGLRVVLFVQSSIDTKLAS